MIGIYCFSVEEWSILMNTNFSRKELERIGCTEEEISLVLKYQRKLPILTNEDSNGFPVNARLLHIQLGVSRDFTKWVKNNIKGYVEQCDYITVVPRDDGDNHGKFSASVDYFLTLDLAKEIAMFTGRNSQASEELKETSRLVRQYFILMERIVVENKEWLAIRDPEKEEYKKMSAEVDAWCYRIWHHHAGRSEYAVEADMLNTIVTGKTSQQLKSEYGVSSYDLIRDYLKKEHNEELLFLEQQNQVLLLMDMGFTERKNMLTKMHEVKFKNVEKVVAA